MLDEQKQSSVRPSKMLATLGVPLCATAIVLTACARPDTPDVPQEADAQLIEGRQIYISQCATCHGAAGGGGRGNALNDGELLVKYPDSQPNIDQVANGKNAMPAFSGRLSADQIEGVVRYTREVLAVSG